MSPSLESQKLDELEFKWGKKRGIGGKKKDVQFYESFTYDGVDYTLYDCVYMYKRGEPAPYIGKLVKIWESAEKYKRIKVQWFFRPSEISYYLRDADVLKNELFFASGDGIGLANINPLEAIAGKCNVVCISTDSRNPQPSAEELQMADYVFYRIFDVKSCIISDQMDDKVGDLEVKFAFNRGHCVKGLHGPKLDSNEKDEDVVSRKETLQLAGNNSREQLNNVKLGKNGDHMLEEENTNVKQVFVKQAISLGKYASGVDVSSNKIRESTGTTIERSTLGAENVGCNLNGEKVKFRDIRSPIHQVQAQERVKSAGKDVKLTVNSSFLDEKQLNMGKEAPRSGHAEDAIEPQEHSKLNKDLNTFQRKLSKANAVPSTEKSESAHVKDSVGTEKDKNFSGNLSPSRERPSKTTDVSRDEIARSAMTNISPNETPKLGSGQAAKLVQSSSSSMKRPLKRSADFVKSNIGRDKSREDKDKTLTSDSRPMDERSLKKAKFNDSIKQSEDNKNDALKKLKEKNSVAETKMSPKHATSQDNRSKLGEGALKEYHNEKGRKLSTHNLPNASTTRFKGDDGSVIGKMIEVTRRPIVEKSKWIKLSWEEKMKTAHNQGRLVLLQNLDPQYTSGEVEDIIWHTFEEDCTARMAQQTAFSNPHSGQAFVIFKSREAADRVVQKLDDGCLMLPNQRPLIACPGVLPKFSEKQTTFVGHLVIDKDRRQIQREMKEAVSTSHYSQNNTIEYEMAMDWCFLQSKSDNWWEKLYQQQRRELKKLRDNLKPK